MSYFGVSTRNGVGLGLGTVPSLTNTPLGYRLAPSLDLSFAGSDTLSPAITFSRTTNATLTNSAGLVANAPMNLLTHSEQFDNVLWSKSNVTVTANAVVSPDGSVTADTLVRGASTTTEATLRATTAQAVTTAYTLSVYVKAGTAGAYLYVRNLAINDTLPNGLVVFNPATGLVVSTGSGYTSATMLAVGNGWYRCIVTGTTPASIANNLVDIGTCNASGVVTGNTGDSIYIWGAQLELGSTATTYNPTTVKNLLGFTENFDNAAWTKSNASISATKVDDIYGQPFAQQVTASASNGTVLSTYTAVASTPYTFSIWMKRVTGTGNIDISADGTTWATQTLTSEWQRFSVTVSPTAGSKTPGVRIATSGDSIYIFGAQLSDSASVDPYVYQPVAAPSSVAYYGPRFDYDPATLAPKGLLIEEQRTNLVTYSEQFDNAYWLKARCTVLANVTSAPNGTTTADKIVEDATNNTHPVYTSFPGSSGLAYTLSFTVKAAERSVAFISTDGASGNTAFFNLSTGVAGNIGANVTATSISNLGNGWYRCSITVAQVSAWNVQCGPAIAMGTASYLGDGTSGIFVWGAQLEAGSFATSYIPTVASQVTRAADVASMIGNNFARWYNQTEGTVYVEATPAISGYSPFVQFDDGTANNRILAEGGVDAHEYVVVGGAVQASIDLGATTANTSAKLAISYKANDFAGSLNAGAVGTDASGSVPIVTTARISANTSGIYSNTIKRIAYYNRRLANTELQAITS